MLSSQPRGRFEEFFPVSSSSCVAGLILSGSRVAMPIAQAVKSNMRQQPYSLDPPGEWLDFGPCSWMHNHASASSTFPMSLRLHIYLIFFLINPFLFKSARVGFIFLQVPICSLWNHFKPVFFYVWFVFFGFGVYRVYQKARYYYYWICFAKYCPLFPCKLIFRM